MRMYVGVKALLLGAFMASSAVAMEATPPASTGLGQAWPNARDVSASPQYHVYRFEREGIRYVQINDIGGVVRGAVAFVGADILTLPIGADAGRWITPSEGAWPATVIRGGQPVYRDEAMTVIAAPQPDGTMQLMALPGECKNPAECSVPGH